MAIDLGGRADARSASAAALLAHVMTSRSADARSHRMPPVQYMRTSRPASFSCVSGRLSQRGNSCELRILGSTSSAPPGGGTMRPISVSYWFRTSITTLPGFSSAAW